MVKPTIKTTNVENFTGLEQDMQGSLKLDESWDNGQLKKTQVIGRCDFLTSFVFIRTINAKNWDYKTSAEVDLIAP